MISNHKNITGEYDVLVSDRVGRTNQKEQYAVYFRKAKVQILVRPKELSFCHKLDYLIPISFLSDDVNL